ncbi:MAG TPA: carboxypeptidase regulatory-like domain-containing protein [Kofleriaceae bacterium]
MRRKLAFVAVAVVLVALALLWKHHASSHATASGTNAGGESGSSELHSSGPRKPAVPLAKATVSGRVVKKDGTGVAGAIVAFSPDQKISGLFAQMGRDQQDLTVTSSADGSFTATNVVPQKYTLSASARGMSAGVAELVVPPGATINDVTLTVGTDGVLVKGTVSDVLGGPVPDAKVRAGRAMELERKGGVMTMVTDEKGTFEMRLPEGMYSIGARHEAYARDDKVVQVQGDVVTVDFMLTPGGGIKGEVVSRDGKAVPDALVSVGGPEGLFNGQSATSDERGAFWLKGLEPGALELTATGGEYTSSAPTVVELGIGEQVEGVRVIVDKAFTISGKVVDKNGTQKGVPGVRIGCFTFTGHVAIGRDASDENGQFEIKGVRPGNYMLFALGDDVMPEIGKSVAVKDKDVSDVLIEMARGVTVTGRVEPPLVTSVTLAPKMVGIANMFDAAKAAMVRTNTDASGAFTLEHVPVGSFDVHAEAPDGQGGKTTIVVGSTNQSDVLVKLEKRGGIIGRVVDVNNLAVTDVTVNARVKKEKKDGDSGFSIDFSGMGRTSAHTRNDGTFQIVGIDAGTYDLTVRDDHGAVAWSSPDDKEWPTKPIPVVVVGKEPTQNVLLSLEDRNGTIRGTALGPDGKAAPDVWVTPSIASKSTDDDDGSPFDSDDDDKGDKEATEKKTKRERSRSEWSNYSPVLTGSDGRFVITKLRKATYKLVAESAKGTAHGEIASAKLNDTVTIKLTSLGVLRGKVTRDNTPIASYDIACSGPGKDVQRRITDPGGAYMLERLPPGEYTCSASTDDGHASAKIDVPQGDTTHDFTLTPWASLTGKVVSVLTGAPVVGVKVLAMGKGSGTGLDMSRMLEDMMGGSAPTTDASGMFVVPHVTPGAGVATILPAAGGFDKLGEQPFTAVDAQRTDIGVIKIVPPRDGDAGTLGMTLADSDTLTVVDVQAGGPAANAGVLIGDVITSISGTPVAVITPKLARLALSSGSIGVGQRFDLTIDRAGTPVQAAVVSVKW